MQLYISNIHGFEALPGTELLSEKRRRELEKLNKAEDKQRCLVAGLLLRHALGEAAEKLMYGEKGKPYLSGGACFNISHSGEYVVLAVSENNLGVDIERIGVYKEKLAQRCCTEEEFLWLENRDKSDFFRLWTGKEAVMKATGLGLAMSARSFSVLPVEDGALLIHGRIWYLSWYELPGHVFCTACEADEEAGLYYPETKDLLL